MPSTTRTKEGSKKPSRKTRAGDVPRAKQHGVDPKSEILGLQQTAGNRAVSQMLKSSGGSKKTPETSSGKPLDDNVRGLMESRFGQDFSGVRVHTDNAANRSAKTLEASAYTKGKDIVFGSGAYQPNTVDGQQRIAHELTHVVQQSHSNSLSPEDQLSSDSDASEREATAMGRMVTGATHAPAITVAATGIQRQGGAKHPLLDEFEKKFADAAKSIRKSATALKLVSEAEAAGVKFGGFAEDGPGQQAWPYTIAETQTVYVPKARTDATIAMSDFLFELNNAIRGPQLTALNTEAGKGSKSKLTGKDYAYKVIELEVEGMLRTGEVWFDMKKSLFKDSKYDVYDSDFFLAEYKSFKDGKKTKVDIIKEILKAPSGVDKSKTHEDVYVEQFNRLGKGK